MRPNWRVIPPPLFLSQWQRTSSEAEPSIRPPLKVALFDATDDVTLSEKGILVIHSPLPLTRSTSALTFGLVVVPLGQV